MKYYIRRVQKAQHIILKVSLYFEIACAVTLIIALLIAFLNVPANLYSLYLDNGFELNDLSKKVLSWSSALNF